MKLVITRDDGTVIDTYEGVTAADIGSSVFGKAIKDWMRKTLKTPAGSEPAKPEIPHDELIVLRDELDDRFPGIGLTFGHTGNLTSRNDSRSWYFFTNIINYDGMYRDCFRFGTGHDTFELVVLLDVARKKLEAFCEKVDDYSRNVAG